MALSVREALLYHYALLIADAFVGCRSGAAPVLRVGTPYWSFATATYRRLLNGEISPSAILRENKILVSAKDQCAYCDSAGPLQWEHVIPLARGGPNTIDNLVLACARCNQSKGAADLIAWYDYDWARVPRLPMGKYLKLLMDAHDAAGTLDATEFPAGQGLHTRNLHHVFGSRLP